MTSGCGVEDRRIARIRSVSVPGDEEVVEADFAVAGLAYGHHECRRKARGGGFQA